MSFFQIVTTSFFTNRGQKQVKTPTDASLYEHAISTLKQRIASFTASKMWTPVRHKPKPGPVELQVKKTRRRTLISRAKMKTKAKLKVQTMQSTKKEDSHPVFLQFQKLSEELHLEVWRHTAEEWLNGMISREERMYMEKNTRKRAAAHDVGILSYNKSALFSTSSVAQYSSFEALGSYDKVVD